MKSGSGMMKHRGIIIGLIAIILLWCASALAAETSYDKYTTVLRPSSQPSTLKSIATHFLVYPFELLRWPADKGAVFFEKHRVDKKVIWIYDKMVDRGITPQYTAVGVVSSIVGTEVDFLRLANLKQNFPDLTTKGWISYGHDIYFGTGAKIGLDRIADTGFHTFGIVQYESRPQEHFYGIGPNTSFGEGTSYKDETTTLESTTGYSWDPFRSLDFKFSYKNVNITNGEDGGRGEVDSTFAPQTIPGLGGDELMGFGLQYNRDTRDHKDNSTHGDMEQVGVSYHEGLGNSAARYFKYRAEASKYFRLKSNRRLLVAHVYGEHNNEIENHEVPFHQMARLGGYGDYPDVSRTLRGFDANRFFDDSAILFNLEYRYTVWEYDNWKMDAIIFGDEGQVFGKFGSFQLKDFRESYGLGIRICLEHVTIFSLEVAHGDEGTQFYVRSSAPF